MAYKKFAERFNHELDIIGVTEHEAERITTTARLFKIPKFTAGALIRGNILPDNELLQNIANEFEVSTQWLLGESNNKTP